MQDPYIVKLESQWASTTHPEERRAIYNLAAHYCWQHGQRLIKEGSKWAIATK